MILRYHSAPDCNAPLFYSECGDLVQNYSTCPKRPVGYDIECPFSLVLIYLTRTCCYCCLLLVNSGSFQLTRTTCTQILLVELVAIKHGHNVVSCSYWQPRQGCFSHYWCSPRGCAILNASWWSSEGAVCHHHHHHHLLAQMMSLPVKKNLQLEIHSRHPKSFGYPLRRLGFVT